MNSEERASRDSRLNVLGLALPPTAASAALAGSNA
eukprot:CAMPEP_0182945496 /NCGR_PEP_ID=MMETSP0105_2-20130417/55608_1 /TAXON_ID=81532 ORGANISM="Acanthoeca-like sp., Strain 10tr" /NCGR_SAMPLE_ID=MMETSP0105_2 /ASSEMBLY_ACC=CAM_ASM_000205 /LENGTH=34 /DNA_ID= /DNA_START= /DNA_END= /DNA_ORIENTATION=